MVGDAAFWQTAVVPLIVPVGKGFTVTVAVPEKSVASEVQLASLSVATVYVVVDDGVTDTVIVGAVPLKEVPSDKVPLIVPLPVTAKDILVVVLCPLQ